MRLMGIFDWWLQVLDFISLLPEGGPQNPDQTTSTEQSADTEDDEATKNKFYSMEEAIYPSAGIVSRRAPVVESKGMR